eukprot:15430537-Alexandrium_andersonii.AAC.1
MVVPLRGVLLQGGLKEMLTERATLCEVPAGDAAKTSAQTEIVISVHHDASEVLLPPSLALGLQPV